ncbi:MAG: hypothetical protein LBR58_09385 [Propionibacteriaceae bacterium]|jgi:branched-chain amino acid transport system permease protein|nr:hypothetical protein [Propionibacteriaceae bacterium]
MASATIAPALKQPAWTNDRNVLRVLAIVFVVFVYVLPLIDDSTKTMDFMTKAMIYVFLGMGLNVVVGYAGLLDLGYIAFYAIGAYTCGILTQAFHIPQWAAVPGVVVACIIAGIIIGGPTLRLRSDYLAIVTLGFGEIIRVTARNLTIDAPDGSPMVRGPSGMANIEQWSFGGWSFTDGLNIGGMFIREQVIFYYFVTTIALVLGVFGISRLANGRLGRAWKAVRDDEDAAEAMGINTYTTKITAYIIGAVWAGLAGQLSATQQLSIAPTSFEFLFSALILMAVVIGGMGSTPGVVLGAMFVSLVPNLLRNYEWAENRYLYFGILLVVVMLFRPKGFWPATDILPWSSEKIHKWLTARKAAKAGKDLIATEEDTYE